MNAQPPLIVVPDTNVLVQGRSLLELPWEELGSRDVDIVICGPVIRELDRLKNRPGRVGRVARAMSTTVRELMSLPGRSDVLREAGPRVTRRLLVGAPAREPAHPGLDLSHDDQAIINHALLLLQTGNEVVLLTDDNFAGMTAEDCGLPVKLMPAEWLKDPENDDAAKDLARRDAEIAKLRAAEPRLAIRFVDGSGAEIERLEARMKRYPSLPETELDRLMARVEEIAQKAKVLPTKPVVSAPQESGPIRLNDIRAGRASLPPVPVTQGDVDKYEADYAAWLSSVRHRLAHFNEAWNARREWPSAVMLAVNDGSRPAEDALVQITASGRFKIQGTAPNRPKGPHDGKLRLSLDLPPEPPKERRRTLGSLMHLSDMFGQSGRDIGILSRPADLSGLHRQDDRFYWREGKSEPVDTMELECRLWRHGTEEDFALHVLGSGEEPIRGVVTARLSAANLSEPVERRLPVRIEFEDQDITRLCEQLVDGLQRALAAKQV